MIFGAFVGVGGVVSNLRFPFYDCWRERNLRSCAIVVILTTTSMSSLDMRTRCLDDYLLVDFCVLRGERWCRGLFLVDYFGEFPGGGVWSADAVVVYDFPSGGEGMLLLFSFAFGCREGCRG